MKLPGSTLERDLWARSLSALEFFISVPCLAIEATWGSTAIIYSHMKARALQLLELSWLILCQENLPFSNLASSQAQHNWLLLDEAFPSSVQFLLCVPVAVHSFLCHSTQEISCSSLFTVCLWSLPPRLWISARWWLYLIHFHIKVPGTVTGT